MTSYELLAADRNAAIRIQAEQRARRAAHLSQATGHPRPDVHPRRLRTYLRLGVSRAA